MMPTLTVTSSGAPRVPWWCNTAIPSAMVSEALSMVLRNISTQAPRDGVAIIIRRLHPTTVTPER